MIENLVQNHGLDISIAGLIVTFLGLALVALMIYLFNAVFSALKKGSIGHDVKDSYSAAMTPGTTEKIPEDELVAIAVAVEIYRRIHFDALQSEISFERGDTQAPWKMVYKFGSRFHRVR